MFYRQLERLKLEDPRKRVVIVAFESLVRVYHKSIAQTYDVKALSFDSLLQTGSEMAPLLQPLSDSYELVYFLY